MNSPILKGIDELSNVYFCHSYFVKPTDENIIATNPDQIIILHSLATEADADVKRALNNWYSLPTNAARNGQISIVDEDYLHIPSHRVALTISRLCGEMND